jgi:hypothetical protein
MRRRRSLQCIIVIGLFILELILVIALLTSMASEVSAQTDHISLQSSVAEHSG